MKTICIYHKRDLDGMCSALIVRSKYPDVELIGYDYGEPIPDVRGDKLFMVDVSLPTMDDMKNIAEKFKHGMIWIDHHKSAIEKWDKYTSNYRFKSYLDSNFSACELVYKSLYPEHGIPKGIELLGKYDSWRNDDKNEWEGEILPFQYGMRSLGNILEIEEITKLLHNNNWINSIINKGRIIIDYQWKQNKYACKNAFEIEFAGKRAICLNAGGFSSQSFDSVWDENKYDLMMPFIYKGKDKFWTVSIYSTKPEIDCSEIAKRFGGGGHKGAAGFTCDTSRMIEFSLINYL